MKIPPPTELRIYNCQDPKIQPRPFGIRETMKAIIHKSAKSRGCFKGPDNAFCHVRKLSLDKFQMRKLLATNMTKQYFAIIHQNIERVL